MVGTKGSDCFTFFEEPPNGTRDLFFSEVFLPEAAFFADFFADFVAGDCKLSPLAPKRVLENVEN